MRSKALRIGLIGSGDESSSKLLRLLTEQDMQVVHVLLPGELTDAHIAASDLDVWLLDLDDSHWHDQLDELMDRSSVPIFFNEHQSIEGQQHLDYWCRNLISRMFELVADAPGLPSATTAAAPARGQENLNLPFAAKTESKPSDDLTPVPTSLDPELLQEIEELEQLLHTQPSGSGSKLDLDDLGSLPIPAAQEELSVVPPPVVAAKETPTPAATKPAPTPLQSVSKPATPAPAPTVTATSPSNDAAAVDPNDPVAAAKARAAKIQQQQAAMRAANPAANEAERMPASAPLAEKNAGQKAEPKTEPKPPATPANVVAPVAKPPVSTTASTAPAPVTSAVTQPAAPVAPATSTVAQSKPISPAASAQSSEAIKPAAAPVAAKPTATAAPVAPIAAAAPTTTPAKPSTTTTTTPAATAANNTAAPAAASPAAAPAATATPPPTTAAPTASKPAPNESAPVPPAATTTASTLPPAEKLDWPSFPAPAPTPSAAAEDAGADFAPMQPQPAPGPMRESARPSPVSLVRNTPAPSAKAATPAKPAAEPVGGSEPYSGPVPTLTSSHDSELEFEAVPLLDAEADDDHPAELDVPMLEAVAIATEFEAVPDLAPALPCDLWVLGASLGGPAALKRFFTALNQPLPICFLLAQHIDAHFLPVLGKILEQANPFYPVQVLVRPGLIEPGTLLLAPIEKRLRFLEAGQIVLGARGWTPPYSPCIDDVLKDVAVSYPGQVHSIVFSGMGEDGVNGARAIANCRGEVWVQDSESCASSVMPDAISKAGLARYRATPESLAARLMARYNSTVGSKSLA